MFWVVGIVVFLVWGAVAVIYLNKSANWTFIETYLNKPEQGSFTDSRNGTRKTYKTVKIGDQVWMAENLNYETANSWCLDDKSKNCRKYGRLYTWNDARVACPGGWHLPSKAEFKTLLDAVGGQATAGRMLRSTRGWHKVSGWDGNGIDAYSFAALPAGWRFRNGGFSSEGYVTYFWGSDASSMNLVYGGGSGNDHASLRYLNENLGFSVRCVED